MNGFVSISMCLNDSSQRMDNDDFAIKNTHFPQHNVERFFIGSTKFLMYFFQYIVYILYIFLFIYIYIHTYKLI